MYFPFVSNSAVLDYNIQFCVEFIKFSPIHLHQLKWHPFWMSLLRFCVLFPLYRNKQLHFMIWKCFQWLKMNLIFFLLIDVLKRKLSKGKLTKSKSSMVRRLKEKKSLKKIKPFTRAMVIVTSNIPLIYF